MFGKEKMFSTAEQILYNKTRLNIPSYTKREEGDKFLIIKDRDLNIFRIYNVKVISKIYDKINNKLNKAKTIEEKIKFKKEIYKFSKTIINSATVSKTEKFVLGEKFKNILKVNLIGAGDHLILELKKIKVNFC